MVFCVLTIRPPLRDQDPWYRVWDSRMLIYAIGFMTAEYSRANPILPAMHMP